MRGFRLGFSTLVTVGILSQSAALAATVRPVDLRCEYREDPLGIDEIHPRLSWRLEALDPNGRGLRQSGYRIIAASTAAAAASGTGDLWDSGRVDSDRSAQIVYGGKTLTSGQLVHWRVQVWDGASQPSEWSRAALWSMGLLRPEDWKAKWIGAPEQPPRKNPASPYRYLQGSSWIEPAADFPAGNLYFRRSIELPAGRRVTEALAIFGGDRGGELFVNGTLVGKVTRFGRPSIYEVGKYLKPGVNVIALTTSREAHNRTPGLMGAVRVAFDSGDPLLVPTGNGWRVSTVRADGWNQPTFNDASWSAARVSGRYGAAPWGEVGYSEERTEPATMLRRDFRAGTVKRATVYLSGLGLSEVYLNGAKVSDDVLSPGLTDYDKRVLYVAYDVTDKVRNGANSIGVMLGNGRYFAPRAQEPITMRSFGTPRLLLQLELESAGGKQTIVSDETWTFTDQGPIRANNEFDGEEYDAGMEIPGWSSPGFSGRDWKPAQPLPAPKGVLAAQMAQPLRVIETVKPLKIAGLSPGVYIFDMGQNMVGWCRLRVQGPRGTRVSLRHAETLNPDGSLYVENLRSARATDTYMLKGTAEEVWEPRFTYHGFRYVEVRGYPGTPSIESLQGRVVHDAMRPAGEFTTSNELLNRLHHNVYWGVRGNYRSIPTDCPQRDERQGWLGDRSVVSWSESYLFDIAAFYQKWEQDIEDAQRPSGSIPDVAPAYWTLYNDGVTWPSTFLLLPNMMRMQYGDERLIERHYPAMKRWIEYMRTFLKDGLMPKNMYGDWCVPPESPELIHSQDPARRTDPVLISTAYFYRMLQLMSEYATLLNRPDDAAAYKELAATMKQAFIAKFYVPERGQFDNGTQTSSVLPLAFGLIPEGSRDSVFARLVEKIEKESNRHIGVGLIGAQWLMRVLSENGRTDLGYEIATQTTYPGWGYMISKGATTVWELWNGDTAEPSMNSGNHVMQIGDFSLWCFEYLAGIRSDPGATGFRRIIIRPHLTPGLDYVRASHISMYGPIRCEWHHRGSTLELLVTVPPNTAATVFMPAKDARSVREGGGSATQAPGVKFERFESGTAVYSVGSGSYTFTAPM